MRMALVLAITVLAPTLGLTAPPDKMYYLGEAKLSSADGKPMGSQVFLVEKIHDRDNARIVEKAIVVHPDGKVEEWTARMVVKDDNTFTLADDSGKTEGGGKLFGPAWKWTYFKATFKASNGVEIEDENFMADESAATARKKISLPDGKVIMYMDMTLKGVTPETFRILRAGLMKK
jgi:hypothetical protein